MHSIMGTRTLSLATTALLCLIFSTATVLTVHAAGKSGPHPNKCRARKCQVWDPSQYKCVSTCSDCEECHRGQCRDKCTALKKCKTCNKETGRCEKTCADCEQCNTYGQCEDACQHAHCTTCNVENGQCESTCTDACTKCDGRGQCVARCYAQNCETCRSGSCVSTCAHDPCTQCDGHGECEPRCDPNRCEQCDTWAPHNCTTTCVNPCERCDGYGACVVDESLKNACGKCPGDPDFDACIIFDTQIAFPKGLHACNTSICVLASKLLCAEEKTQRMCGGCNEDSDCTDCDTCTTDTCNTETNQCEHVPIRYDAQLRCGQCALFHPGVSGSRCDDQDPCTFDSCDRRGRCVHLRSFDCA